MMIGPNTNQSNLYVADLHMQPMHRFTLAVGGFFLLMQGTVI